ncbi:iron chelate uptake ABC transporter family permease subunit [Erwinia sp. CPCC 100877]|nr:iron chelate uptake ABC transporter family permease subunit [Erwinia sp. CPCC 100877]
MIKKLKKNHLFLLLFLFSLLLAFFFVDLNTGYTWLQPFEILQTLLGKGSSGTRLILLEFRLPRALLSLFVGCGFAVAGCVTQSLSRNPLADPSLLGINAGAGLIAVLYIVVWSSFSRYSMFTLPFLALAGGMLSAALIYYFAHSKEQRIAPIRLVLVGIAVQVGLSSLTSWVTLMLDENQFEFVANWNAGSIWGANWQYVSSLLPWLLVLLPYVGVKVSELDILSLEVETGISLGVNLVKESRRLLLAAIALTSVCVAFSGNVGFVGLVCPHLARKLVGSRHRVLLPICALMGAILTLMADCLGRGLIAPTEIPLGIVTAVIGAPYFLLLLVRSSKA